MPSLLKERNLVPIVCTMTILLVSLGFTAYTLSTPERMKIFNYVMFIPAPIAFCFSLYERRSISAALKPLLKIPNAGSLAFGILFPVIFLGLLTAIVLLLGLGSFHSEAMSKIVSMLPKGSGLVFALFLLIGEEYAWRGYLLPRFSEMWGPIIATAVVGVIWAVWHGPLVYGLASKLGIERPLLLTVLQMSAVFVLSFPFAYAYFKSGSILPPVMIHFLWNWLNPALLGNVYRNQPGVVEGNLLVINGETAGGIVLGLVFVAWFVSRSGLISCGPLSSVRIPSK